MKAQRLSLVLVAWLLVGLHSAAAHAAATCLSMAGATSPVLAGTTLHFSAQCCGAAAPALPPTGGWLLAGALLGLGLLTFGRVGRQALGLLLIGVAALVAGPVRAASCAGPFLWIAQSGAQQFTGSGQTFSFTPTAPGSFTVTVSDSEESATATISVLDCGGCVQPALQSLIPSLAVIAPTGTASFTVTLTAPATAGGVLVGLSLAPVNAGMAPVNVVVPAGQLFANFSYVDANVFTNATLTATLGADSATSTISVQSAGAGRLVINEIDYDNVGNDTAEFVEILNAGSMSVPLSGIVLDLVNGSDSTTYRTVDLSPAGALLPGQYLVVGATSVVAALPPSVLKIDAGAAGNLVQNGSPDGVALVNTATRFLLDALSYEGSITAATLPGMPVQSLVEGTPLGLSIADSTTAQGSLCRFPNGADANDAATDWRFCTSPSPGTANVP